MGAHLPPPGAAGELRAGGPHAGGGRPQWAPSHLGPAGRTPSGTPPSARSSVPYQVHRAPAGRSPSGDGSPRGELVRPLLVLSVVGPRLHSYNDAAVLPARRAY